MTDHQQLAEASLEDIKTIIMSFVLELQTVQKKAAQLGQRSARMNQNPFVPNIRERQINIARQFASDLTTFTRNVRGTDSKLNNACSKLSQDLEVYISATVGNPPKESPEITGLLEGMTVTRDSLATTIKDYEDFHGLLIGLRGKVAQLDSSLNETINAVGSFIDGLKSFYERLVRIIDLYS